MKRKQKFLALIGLFAAAFIVLYGLRFQILYLVRPPQYVPSGYNLTKNYDEQKTANGKTFTSKMFKGDKEITVTQTDKIDIQCNGSVKEISGIKLCYFERQGNDPNYDLIMYNNLESTIQIYTNDKNLTNKDLERIVLNF